MKMIKKIILLTIITLIMVGCDYNSNSNINTKTEGYIYGTITIDSCEYIRGTYRLVHKGNCHFCKERRQKELEELVITLKENKIMTKEEAIKYLQQLYQNGGHCWLDEQRIEAIDMAVKALQEEPVSEGLEEASMTYAQEVIRQSVEVLREQYKERYGLDFGKAIMYPNLNNEISNHFKKGAQWQKERMLIKACEFIRTPNIYVVDINRYGGATTNYEATVDKFKKYMED